MARTPGAGRGGATGRLATGGRQAVDTGLPRDATTITIRLRTWPTTSLGPVQGDGSAMDSMAGEAMGGRRCPWCSAPAGDDDTRCPACGAALAQRDDLGGLNIPGVTTVDPALLDAYGRPLHIPLASPSQSIAPTVAVAAVIGGPMALAAIGGMAAITASEYRATRHPKTAQELERVGVPSEVAVMVAQQMDERETPAQSAAQVEGEAVEDVNEEAAPPLPTPAPGDAGVTTKPSGDAQADRGVPWPVSDEEDPAEGDDAWPTPPPPPWRG
jgi:hypothetical protein